MKKNEQDILNIVKNEMENVEVPESLMPEQIEKKLLEMHPPKEAKKKKKKLYYYGGLVAACLVLVAGVYTIGNYTGNSQIVEGEAVTDETVAEETVSEEIPVKEAIPTAKSYEEIFHYLRAFEEKDTCEQLSLW